MAAPLRPRIDPTIGGRGPPLDGLLVQVGGAVRDVRAVVPRRSSTGQRMAFVQIEDMTGSCEVVVFARTFEECVSLLRPDAVVVVRGRVEAGRVPLRASTDDDDREPEPAKIIPHSGFALDDPPLPTRRRNQNAHPTRPATQARRV